MADAQTTSQNEDGQINNDDKNDDDNDVDMAEAEEKTETMNPPTDAQNGGDRKEEVKLEDMFSDDSDDEFPSARPNGNNNNNTNSNNESQSPSGMLAPSSPVAAPTSLKSSDPELMRTFYQRLFPWKYLFRWLNHGPKPTNDFGHREFAFTMPNDQYWRYQSYPTDDLLRKDVRIGIVTAAGYTSADRYYARLHGLLDAVASAPDLSPQQRRSVVIMGGEANYLFEFDASSPHLLSPVPRRRWLTAEMAAWSEPAITALLDVAEAALRDCVRAMDLPATLMRKDRAVGIIPHGPHARIPRESLEETVLLVQKILEVGVQASGADRSSAVPFCAFNGGRDVFVDIGDKSWGVSVCQKWFGGGGGWGGGGGSGGGGSGSGGSGGGGGAEEAGIVVGGDEFSISGEHTLHVGDQFLSAGSNDFKARSVGTTAWIANPSETVELLDELADFMAKKIT